MYPVPWYQSLQTVTVARGDGNYLSFNFAAFTPALPPADRQVYYGSFARDLCDKYLTVFWRFQNCAVLFRCIPGGCSVYAGSI